MIGCGFGAKHFYLEYSICEYAQKPMMIPESSR